MWRSKKLYLFSLPFICVFALLGLSKNASAESYNATYNNGVVDFYSSQQFTGASVNFPWSVNTGGTRFWLNNLFMNDNSLLGYKIAYLSGRVVAELKPLGSNMYICGLNIRDGQRETGNYTECYGTATIRYEDGTVTISNASQVYANVPTSPFRYNLYFDFSFPAESNKKVQFIQFRFYGKENHDLVAQLSNQSGIILEIVQGRSTINYYETPPSEAQIANDLLLQGIAQNQTIINQNTQINQSINDINDTLTDSNVSGSFNTAPIQPFGPIGTITNSILDLPRIILNITPCQPLSPELPYIHENIEIPCPSVFLNGMAGDFMTFLDVIASAGIWYLVARYIFKKVQKLRDPENTDEEYLDI